jgi:predicted Zn-ribbon and HTH transcriptional regulator
MERIVRLAIAVAFAAAAAAVAPLGTGIAYAEDPAKTKPAVQEPVCGRALMTPEEMAEHHAQMRSAKTAEQRDAYRAAHHAQMLARAKERGVTLDPAGCRGGGMGMGRGPVKR